VAIILAREFGNQQWILQCMNGIQECVQNSIQMLSGQPPAHNAQALVPGGGANQYAMPARTAAELQATKREVAHEGLVTPAVLGQREVADQADLAMAQGKVDMFEVLQRQAGLQDPASQGMPPTEVPSEPGSDEWIL
jgi:hypothetical protein